MAAMVAVAFGVACARPSVAVADSKRSSTKSRSASCTATLKRLGVSYRQVERRGVGVAVRIKGDLGGVTYRSYRRRRPVVMSCALAVVLARIGPKLAALGVERATYSTLIKRRRVRGSSSLSKHSFGLAIDVHEFDGQKIGHLYVKDDYEQGLGTDENCRGKPLTVKGEILRRVYCIAETSGRFSLILTPDDNAHHYNHFHLEVPRWPERIR